MTERGRAARIGRTASVFFFAASVTGCRSEAASDRTSNQPMAPAAGADDDAYLPPEWQRGEPDLEIASDETAPSAEAVEPIDVVYNGPAHGSRIAGSAADSTPSVLRVRDDAADSAESLVSRYPFLPFRAHGLPAVSADGSTVAMVTAKNGGSSLAAEFSLDLYDVEQDRRRTHLVLWSYAEEDRLEELNDSLGSAQAAAKRMDGRMSKANALLRSTSKLWQPLGKLAQATDDDRVTTYFGIGLVVTVAPDQTHVTNMHHPTLR